MLHHWRRATSILGVACISYLGFIRRHDLNLLSCLLGVRVHSSGVHPFLGDDKRDRPRQKPTPGSHIDPPSALARGQPVARVSGILEILRGADGDLLTSADSSHNLLRNLDYGIFKPAADIDGQFVFKIILLSFFGPLYRVRAPRVVVRKVKRRFCPEWRHGQ